ncbi:MAG TPA: hypothetical protein VI336_03965 [Candidatus Saccharimonadales bacterium]|nr:hypothetical protein [Candidatus Saccharimonadales bacterium]
MVPTLKAEFKKLLTVRSTYILAAIAIILVGLFTYFGTSRIVYEEEVEPATSSQQSPQAEQRAANDPPSRPETRTVVIKDLPKERLISHLQDNIPVVALFTAVTVVLLMGHEFRYNTITYTLTTSNSRTKALASKIIVSIFYTALVTLLAMATIIAATYAAVHIKDLNLPPQTYNWGYILARLVGYALGFSLLALAIITLVRNLIAGVVAIFLLPTIDAVVGELLKNWDIEATKVLPFSALNRVENLAADYIPRNVPDDGIADLQLLPATLLGATAIFAAYFIGIWIISWYLFLRRDAT